MVVIEIRTGGSLPSQFYLDGGFFSGEVLASGPNGAWMIPLGDTGGRVGPQKGTKTLPQNPDPPFAWNEVTGIFNSTVKSYARSIFSKAFEEDATIDRNYRHVRRQVLIINLSNLNSELTEQQKPVDGTYKFKFKFPKWEYTDANPVPFEIVWDVFFRNYFSAAEAIEDRYRNAPPSYPNPASFSIYNPVTFEHYSLHRSWIARYGDTGNPLSDDIHNWTISDPRINPNTATVGEIIAADGGYKTGMHPGYPNPKFTDRYFEMTAWLIKKAVPVEPGWGGLNLGEILGGNTDPPKIPTLWPNKGWVIAGGDLMFGKMPVFVNSYYIHGALPEPVEGGTPGPGWVEMGDIYADKIVTLEVNMDEGFTNPAPDGPGTERMPLRWVKE